MVSADAGTQMRKRGKLEQLIKNNPLNQNYGYPDQGTQGFVKPWLKDKYSKQSGLIFLRLRLMIEKLGLSAEQVG